MAFTNSDKEFIDAIKARNLSAIKAALVTTANVNAEDGFVTPLWVAVESALTADSDNEKLDSLAILKLLIDEDADINRTNIYFQSVIERVSNKINESADPEYLSQILKLLIENRSTISTNRLNKLFEFCIRQNDARQTVDIYDINPDILDYGVSQLTRININKLIAENQNFYRLIAQLFNMKAFRPKVPEQSKNIDDIYKDGDWVQLEGWRQHEFLALRIRALIEYYLRICINEVPAPKLDENLTPEANVILCLELLQKEIITITETLMTSLDVQAIEKFDKQKNELRMALVNNIYGKIKKLDIGNEYQLACGWDIHAIYISFIMDKDKIIRRIDNAFLGEISKIKNAPPPEVLFHKVELSQDKTPRILPYYPIQLTKTDTDSLKGYIHEVISVMKAKKNIAFKKIYGLLPVADSSNYDQLQPVKIQLIANCPVKSHQIGLRARQVRQSKYESYKDKCVLYKNIRGREKEQAIHYKRSMPGIDLKIYTQLWLNMLTNRNETSTFYLRHYISNSLKLGYNNRAYVRKLSGSYINHIREQLHISKSFIPLRLIDRSSNLERMKYNEQGSDIIVDIKKTISEASKQIIILGTSGNGKSTLLSYIVQQWVENADWIQNKCDWVFYIDAANFLGEQYNQNTNYTLEDIIARECFGKKLSNLELKIIRELINGQTQEKNKILWVIDGLESIYGKSLPGNLSYICEALSKKSNAIITYQYLPIDLTHPFICVETQGFNDFGIYTYIKRYFNSLNNQNHKQEEQCQKLINYITDESKQLIEFTRNPLNLELICTMHEEIVENSIVLNETQLTVKMLFWFLRNFAIGIERIERDKLGDIFNIESRYRNLLDLLSYLAFHALASDTTQISPKMITDCKNTIFKDVTSDDWFNLITQMKKIGLLNKVNKNYETSDFYDANYTFINKRFQELLAARYITYSITYPLRNKNLMHVKDILNSHKYNMQFLNVWPFVAGILTAQPKITPDFLKMFLASHVDQFGIYESCLLMRCLEECYDVTTKEQRKPFLEHFQKWIMFIISHDDFYNRYNSLRRMLIAAMQRSPNILKEIDFVSIFGDFFIQTIKDKDTAADNADDENYDNDEEDNNNESDDNDEEDAKNENDANNADLENNGEENEQDETTVDYLPDNDEQPPKKTHWLNYKFSNRKNFLGFKFSLYLIQEIKHMQTCFEPYLMFALKHEDIEIKNAAILAIEALGLCTDSFTGPLIELMKHSDPSVRFFASRCVATLCMNYGEIYPVIDALLSFLINHDRISRITSHSQYFFKFMQKYVSQNSERQKTIVNHLLANLRSLDSIENDANNINTKLIFAIIPGLQIMGSLISSTADITYILKMVIDQLIKKESDPKFSIAKERIILKFIRFFSSTLPSGLLEYSVFENIINLLMSSIKNLKQNVHDDRYYNRVSLFKDALRAFIKLMPLNITLLNQFLSDLRQGNLEYSEFICDISILATEDVISIKNHLLIALQDDTDKDKLSYTLTTLRLLHKLWEQLPNIINEFTPYLLKIMQNVKYPSDILEKTIDTLILLKPNEHHIDIVNQILQLCFRQNETHLEYTYLNALDIFSRECRFAIPLHYICIILGEDIYYIHQIGEKILLGQIEFDSQNIIKQLLQLLTSTNKNNEKGITFVTSIIATRLQSDIVRLNQFTDSIIDLIQGRLENANTETALIAALKGIICVKKSSLLDRMNNKVDTSTYIILWLQKNYKNVSLKKIKTLLEILPVDKAIINNIIFNSLSIISHEVNEARCDAINELRKLFRSMVFTLDNKSITHIIDSLLSLNLRDQKSLITVIHLLRSLIPYMSHSQKEIKKIYNFLCHKLASSSVKTVSLMGLRDIIPYVDLNKEFIDLWFNEAGKEHGFRDKQDRRRLLIILESLYLIFKKINNNMEKYSNLKSDYFKSLNELLYDTFSSSFGGDIKILAFKLSQFLPPANQAFFQLRAYGHSSKVLRNTVTKSLRARNLKLVDVLISIKDSKMIQEIIFLLHDSDVPITIWIDAYNINPNKAYIYAFTYLLKYNPTPILFENNCICYYMKNKLTRKPIANFAKFHEAYMEALDSEIPSLNKLRELKFDESIASENLQEQIKRMQEEIENLKQENMQLTTAVSKLQRSSATMQKRPVALSRPRYAALISRFGQYKQRQSANDAFSKEDKINGNLEKSLPNVVL